MRHSFYDSSEYRNKQAASTRLLWASGQYQKLETPPETRKCIAENCDAYFKVKPHDPKKFCSQTCAASFNNHARGPLSSEVRAKISNALRGRTVSGAVRRKLILPLRKNCLYCQKQFDTPRWQNHKYCSVDCSGRDIGSRRTSPRAARAKAGIRLDINPRIYFYSRWEANFARVLNFLNIRWDFQAKTFELRNQKYTPDFYLPDYNLWIEIKNFLAPYSAQRDREFRELYPQYNLLLLLKPDYLKIQETFSQHVKGWEFS